MTKKQIRTIGDPVLRSKSKEVERIDNSILKLVNEMLDTISGDEVAGVGLAAPQIGILKRVIVVFMDNKFNAFINPEVEILDNESIVEEEGCLSIYSIKTPVPRPKKILIKALTIKGEEIEMEADDIMARIFLHEVDHLDGVLFIDHLEPENRKNFLSKINKDMIL